MSRCAISCFELKTYLRVKARERQIDVDGPNELLVTPHDCFGEKFVGHYIERPFGMLMSQLMPQFVSDRVCEIHTTLGNRTQIPSEPCSILINPDEVGRRCLPKCGPVEITDMVTGSREIYVRARLKCRKIHAIGGLIYAQFLRCSAVIAEQPKPFLLQVTTRT